MNAAEKALLFLESAQKQMAICQEEVTYQEAQVKIWSAEAKKWQKRAQDAEVELNNIREWARTPTRAEQNANNSMVGKSINDVAGYSPDAKASFVGHGPMGLDR